MALRAIRRRIVTDPDADRHRSLDEQIHATFRAIVEQAAELEDPQMRDLWLDAVQKFAQTGDAVSLKDVTTWRRPVVELDEFLFGKGYLGLDRNEVYPGVLKMLQDVDTDQYDEVVMKGAIGIGKTTGADLAMARDIYKLSCMRSPQETYKIAKGSPIVFTIQSVRLNTAKRVVFEELGRYIYGSPYFKKKFPSNPLITSMMIFPEFNIQVMPVSSASSAVISMNVIGGQMDEMNFMQKTLKSKSSQADEAGSFDQAKQLYNTLASRRKSRFTHRNGLPGALYLISSSRFPDDFTEVKAKQAAMYGGNDPRIYVFEGSQWSVKGRDKFSPLEFRVQIGNETFPSKVLEDDEPANNGCDVIVVPMDFYDDFKRDPDQEIRNMAGLTTLSTRPFFGMRHCIAESFKLALDNGYANPLSIEEAEFSIGLPDLDRTKLRTDVKQERVAHIDLGITKDACGLAVGHLAGHKISQFKNEQTGKMDTEILPVIAYDVILRIKPPLGGEIQLDDVRKFLRKLNSKYNLNIKWVTFDGFQSADSRQILAKQGFNTGYLSVEKIEPWRTFRDALYDGRVLIPGNNFLNKELVEVEIVRLPNNKEKVDHRPNGTKDVADAVVGVAAFIFRRRVSWRPLAFDGKKTGLFLFGNPERAANVRSSMQPKLRLPEASARPQTLRRNIARRMVMRR